MSEWKGRVRSTIQKKAWKTILPVLRQGKDALKIKEELQSIHRRLQEWWTDGPANRGGSGEEDGLGATTCLPRGDAWDKLTPKKGNLIKGR